MPSPRSRQLVSKDKQYVWHPFTQMQDWLDDPEPLVIERGKKATLFDSEGRAYLDGVSSLWVSVHGHSHPRLNAALSSQLEKLQHSTLLGLANTPSIELAEALIKVAPAGLAKVFYSDSGSTAMEIACKLAYQFWQNQGGAIRRPRRRPSSPSAGPTTGTRSAPSPWAASTSSTRSTSPCSSLPASYRHLTAKAKRRMGLKPSRP